MASEFFGDSHRAFVYEARSDCLLLGATVGSCLPPGGEPGAIRLSSKIHVQLMSGWDMGHGRCGGDGAGSDERSWVSMLFRNGRSEFLLALVRQDFRVCPCGISNGENVEESMISIGSGEAVKRN